MHLTKAHEKIIGVRIEHSYLSIGRELKGSTTIELNIGAWTDLCLNSFYVSCQLAHRSNEEALVFNR